MVTYFSFKVEGDSGSKPFLSQNIFCNMLLQFLQNFENHHSNHNCANILFSRSTLRRVSFKKNKLFCNLHNDFGILLTFFIRKFLHAHKIVIFIVVYWKPCGVPWKWNTTVNICLFSYFNLTFTRILLLKNLTKAETLKLGGNKG